MAIRKFAIGEHSWPAHRLCSEVFQVANVSIILTYVTYDILQEKNRIVQWHIISAVTH